MKEPPAELVEAVLRGDTLDCATPHRKPTRAGFYCAQCRAPRCSTCAHGGVCVHCRTVVRSIGAIKLLAAKEKTS